MATKNGVTYKVVDLPTSKYGVKCPYTLDPKGITIHNTYNDATAENEISYMQRNNNQVSYHIAVDDKQAIQGVPFNRNTWHAGDGGNGYGNRNHISVEVCYSKSGGAKYTKALANTVKLVAYELHVRKWPISKVKKHQDWSGKYCPHRVLDDKAWVTLLNDIEKELNRLNKPSTSKPAESTSNETYKVVTTLDGYTTAANAKNRKDKRSKVSAGTYHVYKKHDGMINITSKKGVPGSWINPADNKTASKPKSFLIRTKPSELYYYNKADWNAKVATVKKGTVLTVVDTLTVNGSKMYKLKSGTYITANPQYVEKVNN